MLRKLKCNIKCHLPSDWIYSYKTFHGNQTDHGVIVAKASLGASGRPDTILIASGASLGACGRPDTVDRGVW